MSALIEEYHKEFLEAVQRLWDLNKDKYAPSSEINFL
jgi:hypothetical protein